MKSQHDMRVFWLKTRRHVKEVSAHMLRMRCRGTRTSTSGWFRHEHSGGVPLPSLFAMGQDAADVAKGEPNAEVKDESVTHPISVATGAKRREAWTD